MEHAVLVVTGGVYATDETEVAPALRKMLGGAMSSSGAWLDLHIKLGVAERVSAVRQAVRRLQHPGAALAAHLADEDPSRGAPELTEVLLCTLLQAQGMPFEVVTWSRLFADAELRERLLARCDCVFASTTLIGDLSELRPMLRLVKRPGNRVVLGGALVGILAPTWPGCEAVDLLAVGWGERLVPALVAWIRSDFERLEGDSFASVVQLNGTPALRAGLPEERSLDSLPRPDWSLAERVHARRFTWVSYESVRGCPYRCAFCNYPFLFDDNRYRLRSAEVIDADWQALEEQGVRFISCLDSLFTVPRKRLETLCDRLIARGSRLRWLCYARADDLSDPTLTQRLAEAGCQQVQIGVESGDQGQLDRMNKRCTVESNALAIKNCRDAGITSLITVIIGFPGETEASVAATLHFLRQSQPDFCFLTPFSTKFMALPALDPEARSRSGLLTRNDGSSSFPAWRHDTMDVAEAIDHVDRLYGVMAEERLSLDGGGFYGTSMAYRPEHRAPLLDFQRSVMRTRGPTAWAFSAARRITSRGAQRELRALVAPA